MKINIYTASNMDMRYNTVGDWFYENDTLNIVVDNMLSEDEAFLVALHELIEMWLCRKRGIPQSAVDDFDMNYKGECEVGDDPSAPYRKEHRFAMLIEHLMAHELGLAGYGEVK